MRLLAVFIVAIVLASERANAQNLLPRGEWGGTYWGVAAGGVWGNVIAAERNSDFVRTGIAGYGFQLSRLYFGGELDATLGGARNLTRLSSSNSISAEVNWSVTARGRIGFAFDDGLLAFVIAGPAWASQKYELSTPSSPSASVTSEIVRGVVWGGGVEMKLLPFVSGRIEAMHFDYGMNYAPLSKAFQASLSTAASKGISTDETVVRAGLIVRWN